MISWNENIHTTHPQSEIELLGSHEFYYNAFSNSIFAITPHAFNILSLTPMSQHQQLLKINSSVALPPVFIQDVTVLYQKINTNDGHLNFYLINNKTQQFELAHSELVDNSTSLQFHRYSLLRVADGVIFKAYGSAEILHFKTIDYSWNKSVI